MMNELEQEMLKLFHNFATQYERDKAIQEALIKSLFDDQKKQINSLAQYLQDLTNAVNTLSNRVQELETAYQDVLNILEE